MAMRWLSIRDVEMGLKRWQYRLFNGADGTLIWDARTRQYVGHIETPAVQQCLAKMGLSLDDYEEEGRRRLADWCGIGKGADWGGGGW